MKLERGIINEMNEIESKSNNPQICITTRENIPQKIRKWPEPIVKEPKMRKNGRKLVVKSLVMIMNK